MAEQKSDKRIIEKLHQKILRLEKKIRELEEGKKKKKDTELYKIIFNAIPYIVWVTDAEGNACFFNKAWTETTGRKIEDSLGTGWVSSVHPDDKEELISKWQKAYRNGEPYSGECRFKGHNGLYHWVMYIGKPVKIDGKIIKWVGINVNINDRKRFETMKTKYMNWLCHEIRNPLFGLVASLGLIDFREIEKMSSEAQEYIELAKISSGQLVKIVNKSLTLSKLESKQKNILTIHKKFSPYGEIETSVKIQKSSAIKKDIKIILKIPNRERTLYIFGDPNKFREIIINLLANAIKFTQNGQIFIIMTIIDENKDKPELLICVEDSGCGMSAEHVNRLLNFKEFVQVGKIQGGSGLGLSISNDLITLMGGTLTIDSELDKGSKFNIKIPLKNPTYKTVPKKKVATSLTVVKIDDKLGKKRRILVCDDNKICRFLLGNMLTNMGFVVTKVPSGEKAVEKVKSNQFLIIFMDLEMPGGMDGFETTIKIRTFERTRTKKSIIICMSGNIQKESQIKAVKVGMNHYLTKPCTSIFLYRQLLKWGIK